MNADEQETLDDEKPMLLEEKEPFSAHVWWIAVVGLMVVVLLVIARAVGGF